MESRNLMGSSLARHVLNRCLWKLNRLISIYGHNDQLSLEMATWSSWTEYQLRIFTVDTSDVDVSVLDSAVSIPVWWPFWVLCYCYSWRGNK